MVQLTTVTMLYTRFPEITILQVDAGILWPPAVPPLATINLLLQQRFLYPCSVYNFLEKARTKWLGVFLSS